MLENKLIEHCSPALAGLKTANMFSYRFTSYGWGGGQWIREWEERCRDHKIVLVSESVICQEEPDDEAQEKCRTIGKALV